jgi:hypothetical protein
LLTASIIAGPALFAVSPPIVIYTYLNMPPLGVRRVVSIDAGADVAAANDPNGLFNPSDISR